MLKIELLTTAHCSLCEVALDMLLGMPEMAGIALQTLDIAVDDELIETYAERIPVLRAEGVELAAPFARADVLVFLQSLATHRV